MSASKKLQKKRGGTDIIEGEGLKSYFILQKNAGRLHLLGLKNIQLC